MKQLRVTEVPAGVALTEPIEKGWHARRGYAYIVHDTLTNTVTLATKLTVLAEHLNQEYARCPHEQVCARGLYQAADKRSGYTGGRHKMRYLVSRCDVADSHLVFEDARAGVEKATVLTEAS